MTIDPDTLIPIPPPDTGPTVGLPAPGNRITVHVPDRHNPRLTRVMESVRADEELYALWYC